MTKLQKHHKYSIFIFILLIITLFRLGKIYQRTIFNDFNAYYDVSKTILQGLDPYNLNNLSLSWVDPPIVFPGYISFYIPFAIIDLNIAKYIYLSLNITLGLLLAIILFKNLINVNKANILKPDRSTCFLAIAIFTFLNSTPFLTCLKHGQTSILLAFCLFAIIERPSCTALSYFYMSMAAVLKYSIMPFYGIILFCKQHFRLCIISFLLFIAWAIVPILFGHNIPQLYIQYFTVLKQQISGGFNSFPISGYNMIQLDFFKIPFLGASLKLIFIIIFFHLLYKGIKQKNIGLNFMFMTMCVTMITVYHRVYDMVLIMPLLIMVSITLLKDKKIPETIIAMFFIIFFMLPESIVFAISNTIGQITGNNPIVYISKFLYWKTIFPILPINVLILSTFSVYLCYFVEEKFYFAFANK